MALAPSLALADAAGVARDAVAQLEAAAVALEQAGTRADRVAALTDTVQAYERGLSALREGLRGVTLEERALRADLSGQEAELGRLLAALQSIERGRGATALLHPDGPLPAIRAGMLTAELVPALNARAQVLAEELADLRATIALRQAAETQLETGLTGIRDARLALAQAISNRTDLPARLATDEAAMQALINDAETLAGFAANFTAPAVSADHPTAWPLPVLGTLLRDFNEVGADGIARPGWVIAAAPEALVTAPVAGTVRFAGPLLERGDVVILEPDTGNLLILAGLAVTFA
ncbi:MAG: peptidase M23, partial [Pseudomonadota bacterium]